MGGGSLPTPPKPPAPPSPDAAGKNMADADAKDRKRQGYASTVLTDPLNPNQTKVGSKTLLGM